MTPSPALPTLPTLHFGPYTLDPAAVELRHNGQPVALRPKAYAVLLALLRRPGEMVSKEALLDAVWGRRFITEGVIKSVVTELRNALGDDAKQPCWIATVPGLGYRFIGPLLTAAATAAAPPGHPAAPTVRRGNLPALLPQLIGREGELQALADWLPVRRLVSITGSSGMGKTRLALAAAHAQADTSARWPGGVWLMELAPLAAASTAADLCAMWAQGLQLDAQAGSSAATLARALAPMRLLLVLDNAEHLLTALAPLLAMMLAQAPGLHLLLTSQEALRLPDEQQLRLAPLALPNWPGAQDTQALPAAPVNTTHDALLASSPAVRLFLDRVALRLPGFSLADGQVQAVADICRALDGVPLALELAAARVPLLGVQGVAERLLGEAEARLQLLSHGARNAVPRQRSLRDAVDWSHALLDERQRRVWRRLAVFRGGFTLEAAQAVCADPVTAACEGPAEAPQPDAWQLLETLESLVEKSLLSVQPQAGGAPRFAWLESLRACALERLHEAGESAAAARAHLHFMAAYWQRADARSISDPILLWLARHLPELANLRSALRAAAADPGCGEAGLALLVHSAMLWQRAGLAREGRAWCDAFQAQAQSTSDTTLRAGHDLAMAVLATYGNVYPKAPCVAAALRAAAAFEQQGDRVRAYFALHLAFQLSLRTQPALDSATLLARMAGLEQAGWSELLTRYLRHARGYADRMAGHTDAYLHFCREEVARCQRLNAVAEGWAAAQGLMLAEHDAGQPAAALQVGGQALAEIRTAGRLHQHAALLALWTTMLAHGGNSAATRLALAEALPVLRSTSTTWMAHGALAWLAASEARPADAARLLGWCEAAEQARNEGRSAGGYIARAASDLAAHLGLCLGAAELAAQRAAGATLGAEEAEARALWQPPGTG